MKKRVVLKAMVSTLVTGMGLSKVSAVHAGSIGGFGGATEITQILNNSELLMQSAQMYEQVQQTIMQVQMAQQQLRNLINAPQMIWGAVKGELQQLTRLVSEGRALGYALGHIDETFKSQFKGYVNQVKGDLSRDYKGQSREWIQTTLDSLKSALKTAGMQSEQFATEQSAMETIQSIASSAPGALQAAQAGVMVASQQVQQLQKLRQLFMSQMQAQNSYLAKQEQQQANDRSTMDSHFLPYNAGTPGFQSRGGKN